MAQRIPWKSLAMRSNTPVVSLATLQQVQNMVQEPFMHLTKLFITIRASMLLTLVDLIPRIKELIIHIELDPDPRVLHSLVPLRDLEVLVFHYHSLWDNPVPIILNSILDLRQFPKLRELKMPELAKYGANRYLDRSLARTFQCLPLLRKIDLDMKLPDSMELLIALGENCPHLEECNLGGRFDLYRLEDYPVPLSPSLRKLQIEETLDTMKSGEDDAHDIALELARHAPLLEDLNIREDSDFTLVIEADFMMNLHDRRGGLHEDPIWPSE